MNKKPGRPPQIIIEDKMECCRCKKWLDLDCFHKSCIHSSGYRSICKKCRKEQWWYISDIYRRLKYRTSKNIISQKRFKIWYKQQKKECVYCKTKEVKNETYRLQIDRKNSLGFYNKNNMVLACRICNIAKGNFFTFEEMKLIGKIIKEIRKNRD